MVDVLDVLWHGKKVAIVDGKRLEEIRANSAEVLERHEAALGGMIGLVQRHGRRGRAQQQSQNQCLHGRTKLKRHTTRTIRPLFVHRDAVRCGAARRIGGVLGANDPLHWFVCIGRFHGSI